MLKEYYIGLDMGTSSVGWSVTDTQYKILRAKGKDLWGVREFDAAEGTTAARTFRVARRRRQRETARLGLLKLFFAKEIEKVDAAFFFRLEESKYHAEDRKTGEKDTLFADHSYTNKEYFRAYPTIFHLRKELIDNEKEHDIRLVYLAIANMFKHRGHFLNVGLSAEQDTAAIPELFERLMEAASEIDEAFVFPDIPKEEWLEEALSDHTLSRTQKTEKLAKEFGIAKKEKVKYEILKAICGQKVNPVLWFGEMSFHEDTAKLSFSFRDDMEEVMGELGELLDAEQMDFLDAMKEVHDAGCLCGIMQGYQYLSHARVASYEKHKKDLHILKKELILKYCPEKYDAFFREMQKGNYSAYVGSVNAGDKKRRNTQGRKREDLYASIKKILEDIPDCEEKDYVLNEIQKESFLPKQLTSENGIIPNQIHLKELNAILKNAEKYLPFLGERDETGLSISEKISQLFAFQIPYFVGPLKNTKTNHAWVVRKSQGMVYPWNLEEMVDMKATTKAFIENLVGTCTYLRGEKVLPKASLLYEKFQVLNELNLLRIAGERLTAEQKQELYNTLFLTGKKVTRKMLARYLVGKGLLEKGQEMQISGIDGDFKASLSSYRKFYGVFGEELRRDSVQEIAEEIIRLGTIYGNDRKHFIKEVEETYGDVLSQEQLKKIRGFKFREWGRLSREFLALPGRNKTTDSTDLPLIEAMWESNVNLMELMSERYTYQDALKERTEEAAKTLTTLEYDDLEGMYLSAPVKRMIWQSILILKEIVSVMGCEPKRIFVEMARENGEKNKRTVSRQKDLLEKYRKCKNDLIADELRESLENTDEKELRQKKLYLYYTQKAKCMYTGETIKIADLFKDNLYDIDHIYPRHFVKDDSILNNLVLVDKRANARKSDKYPLEDSIYQSQKSMWKSLLDGGFITEEKYKRLTGRSPFTEEQMAGFINRQLVETRQGTKVLAKIMEMAFEKTEVVYVKAGLVSDFRHDCKNIMKWANGVKLSKETDDEEKYYSLLKSRVVNDFHHAQDAYLNIVVGNVYHTKFTKDPANFIQEYQRNPEDCKYHMDKIFFYDVKRSGEMAWIAKGEHKTIDTVKKMVDKNSPLITRMSFEAHGELYKATRYGKEKATKDAYIPLKSNDERMQDVTKYGGFTAVSGAYFFLVEHVLNKKKVRSLEFMPLYLKDKIGEDIDTLEAYCKDTLGLINPSVRMRKIRFQSLVKKDSFYMHISGRSGNQISMRNAVSLCVKREWINYIKKIEGIMEKDLVGIDITPERNLMLYDMLTEKMQTGIYRKRPNPVGDKLQKRRELFAALSEKEQCRVLLEILKLTSFGLTQADLTQIGESAKAGTMKISKNISDAKEFKLIHQSPAGLYEKEIDLLRI